MKFRLTYALIDNIDEIIVIELEADSSDVNDAFAKSTEYIQQTHDTHATNRLAGISLLML